VNEIEYIDEDVQDETAGKKPSNLSVASGLPQDGTDPYAYETNTKNFDPLYFEVISPEEVQKAHEAYESVNPNPEFHEAVALIEKANSRKLTRDEYVKAADSYAAILAERDEERRKTYEGKYNINPMVKQKILQLLLENKPAGTAMRELVRDYEDSMLAPLADALQEARGGERKTMEVKKNRQGKKLINIRYKGKCRIASDENGKVIVIDNKNDVNLLHMKYRKEWIDKKYPNDVKGKQIRTDDDEFV
jgi:hypothetical protein